jgi:hypothetical protein
MSAISSITLLNTFAVTDLSALQEKTVQIGYKEVRELAIYCFFHVRGHSLKLHNHIPKRITHPRSGMVDVCVCMTVCASYDEIRYTFFS